MEFIEALNCSTLMHPDGSPNPLQFYKIGAPKENTAQCHQRDRNGPVCVGPMCDRLSLLSFCHVKIAGTMSFCEWQAVRGALYGLTMNLF